MSTRGCGGCASPAVRWRWRCSVADATPALRGRLVAAAFARDLLPSSPLAREVPPLVVRQLERWAEQVDAELGPASSARAVVDVAVLPLFDILGYVVLARHDERTHAVIELSALSAGAPLERSLGDRPLLALVAGGEMSLDALWRVGVHGAIAARARWVFCCNGYALRVVDGQETWTRDFLEIDFRNVPADTTAQLVIWSLLGAGPMSSMPAALDRAAAMSARHGVDVCKALGSGVLDALEILVSALRPASSTTHPPAVLFEQALTVLYRILFLLFAEARGLVPLWHPIYRNRYGLERIVTALLAGGVYRGLWQALQAISRLAHAGCDLGDLRVTAFNGRLFSPAQVHAFEHGRVDDHSMAQAVLAVASTAPSRRASRARILYRDLDVEQLGAVYERVLDYAPSPDGAAAPFEPFEAQRAPSGDRRATRPATPALTRTRDTRKATGSFYTPRAVTSWLVRRTLEPLVRGRSSEQILRLRVLDPAMGSGACLVAACRFLAAAAEAALIAEGRWHPLDVTAEDRARLRREIASSCLYGVDLNPMAVQLARLSLWLVSLAADKPLSFLDHHLVAGDSLIGAATADLRRQPGGGAARASRAVTLPMFGDDELFPVLEHAVRTRLDLAAVPDEAAATVQAKELQLSVLDAKDSGLGRWRRVLDLWCAGWFNPSAPDRSTFQVLVDHVLHGASALPDRIARPLLDDAEAAAAANRFLHWELAFPEVFRGPDGQPFAGGGFDAVVGNPPWDMLRGDSGEGDLRAGRKNAARHLCAFVRESGVYRVEARAHLNRYQLFVERAVQLTKRDGRIGLVLPSGMATDVGAGPLRRFLFDRAEVDEIVGLDNREALFPIHRGVRFVLATCTVGRPTTSTRCRFGVTRAADLDHADRAMTLSRSFLTRLSGADDLGIPELATAVDLRIVERISATVPRLGAARGWGAAFGRELNATADRGAFAPLSGSPNARPVVEGKQIDPFRASLDRCRFEIAADTPRARRVPQRPRLAYRDVASATNRVTLIAAIIPPRAVTTHTLFCLRTSLPAPRLRVLCALLNSFVANYLVRLRVTTHVTASLMERLFVPFVADTEPVFDRLATLSATIERSPAPVESMAEFAEVQALVGRLYGLSPEEFAHVLSTFPLVPANVREACLRAFLVLTDHEGHE
jgi:hypothetical protein